MICVRVVGLVCHPPAVVLHGRLIVSAHSARSFALALFDGQIQSVHCIIGGASTCTRY